MGKLSKNKGSRGERELSQWLRDNLGIEARRGRQYRGGDDSPDVICSLPLHFESKRCESLSIYPALAQAAKDCGKNIPVVAHKRNRKPWIFIVEEKHLVEFCKAILLSQTKAILITENVDVHETSTSGSNKFITKTNETNSIFERTPF